MSIKDIIDVAAVFLPILFEGFKMTILIAITGLVAGFCIGVVFGCMRHSENRLLKGIAGVYINIFRPLPLLVQALYFYYVMPKMLHVELSGLTAAILVMSLNSGAFFTEIVRGALDSVDKGIKEAGMALGLSKLHVFFHITIPTAFRAILPSLCNQFIISIKDTSVLTVITINEMTQMTRNYVATNFNTIEAYTILALAYLAILSVLTVAQKILEKKLAGGWKILSVEE